MWHDNVPALASPVPQSLKNLPVKQTTCNAGVMGLIPGWGRSPAEGNGKPLQYSCLGYPIGSGALWAIGHGVAKELGTT